MRCTSRTPGRCPTECRRGVGATSTRRRSWRRSGRPVRPIAPGLLLNARLFPARTRRVRPTACDRLRHRVRTGIIAGDDAREPAEIVLPAEHMEVMLCHREPVHEVNDRGLAIGNEVDLDGA